MNAQQQQQQKQFWVNATALAVATGDEAGTKEAQAHLRLLEKPAKPGDKKARRVSGVAY